MLKSPAQVYSGYSLYWYEVQIMTELARDTACIPKSSSMTSKLQLTFVWCADGQFVRVSLQVMIC